MIQINNLLAKRYFPVSLKYISLIAYIVLIVVGLTANSTDAAFLNQLRNTNLGNLIVYRNPFFMAIYLLCRTVTFVIVTGIFIF